MVAVASEPNVPASPGPAPAPPVAPAAGGPPARPVPGTPPSAPPTPPPREPWVRDVGPVRRDAVWAVRWSARGLTKVTGNVDAEIIDVEGPLSIGGDLKAGSLRVEGPLEVLGSVHVDGPAKLDGGVRIGGRFGSHTLESTGPFLVRGALRVDGVANFAGEVLLEGDAQFGRLVGSGSLGASQTVSAEQVVFHVERDSTIGTLLARSIVVTRPPALLPFKLPLIGKERPTLTVLRIEGQDVRLDGVSVEYLKAERIVLGPDCHVARVSGEVVSADASAHVGPESRSPPPHGISR
jgi:hypothetical protein